MSRLNDILRFEYMLLYQFPIFLAIYINKLPIGNYLDIIFAYVFIGFASNVINDVFDMKNVDEIDTRKRLEGISRKEMIKIFLMTIACGTILLIKYMVENALSVWYIIAIIISSLLYTKLKGSKGIPFIDQVFGTIAMLVIPYLLVIQQLSSLAISDYFIILLMLPNGFIIQSLQQTIDKEAISKISVKQQRYFILGNCIVTFIVAVIFFCFNPDIYLAPIGIVVASYFYEFIRPTPKHKDVKEGAIVLGNVMNVYIFLLIFL